MTVTNKRYQAGFNAAKTWLQANEGMYASMIPDSVIWAVVQVVINADEAERVRELPHPVANTAPPTAPVKS